MAPPDLGNPDVPGMVFFSMTFGAARSRDVGLRAYTITLIICSALYFIRVPGLSIYIFDAVWLVGLALFPQQFLRMPSANYLSLIGFTTATIVSIAYVAIDSRPIDIAQAIIITIRFMQMAICANFFYNVVHLRQLEARDLLMPALIAILIPLWGGLTLHAIAPSQTIVFNRYAGYFGNPNSLALYVVVSSSVFYSLMRFQLMPRLIAYPLMLAFVVTAAYSMMLSGSNSGMLLFGIVTVIAFTSTLRSAIFLALATAFFFLWLAALKGMILPWALDLMSSDFAGWRRTGTLIVAMFEGTDFNQLGSQSYRNEVESFLFHEQFSDSFRVIFGLGPGQSKYLIYMVEGLTVTIHNFYLLIFLEYGVFGSAFFVMMALLAFHRYRWTYQVLLMFSGFLLASSGTPVLYLPFFWVPLFAALAGLTRIHFSLRERRYIAWRPSEYDPYPYPTRLPSASMQYLRSINRRSMCTLP